ncbi:hypothetical protein V4D00_18240 [Ralstonia solanacearum]|uniref:hypothetical protein n=1 Tax=Ralstonia solanacearum TaxID=305 RepID=UPI002F94A253
MATMNEHGHVFANCPTCSGALTSFLIGDPQRGPYGQIFRQIDANQTEIYRLARCTGCGAGALITLSTTNVHGSGQLELTDFYPEAEVRQLCRIVNYVRFERGNRKFKGDSEKMIGIV